MRNLRVVRPTEILGPCPECESDGPHEILDDEGDYVVARCADCKVEFEVEV